MISYRCKKNNLKVIIENKAYEKIIDIVRDINNIETGGIIIGYYNVALTEAIITSVTSQPSDSKAGFSWFVRGIQGLKDLLISKWKIDSEYYLGEWHYHPIGSALPSNVDISQIRKISKDKRFNCPEPILLIVSNRIVDWEISVTVIKNNLVYHLSKEGHLDD